MQEEEIVFQLLEQDRKARIERIVEERKITTEDCLVLGILRIHREVGGLHGNIASLRGEIERIHKRIDEINKRIGEIGGRMDEIDRRVDEISGRVEETNDRIDETNKRIDETNRRIEGNFKWTIGMILGTWASLLAILIPILLK